MELFKKLFGRNEKIRVQFFDDLNQKIIGVSEMLPNQLPSSFNVETTMTLEGAEWRITEAIPVNSTDFIKSKSLILKMRKVEKLNTSDILFTLPSISNELPGISEKPLFNNFEILITEDDWRQNEFLNISSFPLIDIEISKINDIRANHCKRIDDFMNAFTKCHVRDVIGKPNLNVDFTVLKKILNIDNVGSLKLINNQGFVLNGFTFKTDNTTFYGILDNETVTDLGIHEFSDFTIDEVQRITKTFGLIFVNWYHSDIITGDN
ncbi:hypothetical protein [Mucilaginibacter sp. OK283]|uniref:hypothetical protein n=1 Tax=Mucilaginibacter sp. OK283 TaxID=1881049 RepID=UPI0008B3E9A1|nr:hypothetical protein [Mucilaginibacter sp. OK283]SEO61730.1 hypothetical protein SAMN05428947_103145 [Mucilaginibacter sp. OK283]